MSLSFPRFMVSAAIAAIAAMGGVFLSACADSPPPKAPDAVKPMPVAQATPTPLPTAPPPPERASAVRISDEIVKTCGIKEPDAYFAFDSANVRESDAGVLTQVVSCFTSGALKGRTLKLVGHADPRGSSDYNVALGQSRADAVAGYLVGKGLAKSKTESTSRGAMDSTGADEPTWARDRRVDLMLGQ